MRAASQCIGLSLCVAVTIATLLPSGKAHAAEAASFISSIPPVFTWTGFYGGENGAFDFTGGSLSAPKDFWSPALDAAGGAFTAASGTSAGSTHNPLGGGQIGFNYQIASAVLGVEGDLTYAGPDALAGTVGVPRATESLAFTSDVNSHWLSTFRGRLGGAINRLLVYATGGLAIAGRNYNNGYTILEPDGQNFSLGSSSTVAAGLALGAGLEYALNKNWTLKGEYLYTDLGPGRSFTPAGSALPVVGSRQGNLDETVVRAALNYKFDWLSAPGTK